MRQVILSMKDFIFADAVARALINEKGCDFAVQKTESPDEILKYCEISSPYVLLMEVSSYPAYALSKRLAIGEEVKKQNPDCHIVLLVDENSEKEIAKQVRQAKKEGLIDNFIYGSTSASYLVALIDTI